MIDHHDIIRFFGIMIRPEPIAVMPVSAELVFELKSGCFFSAIVVESNVSIDPSPNDLNTKVNISIQVTKTMTPDEILRMWLMGEIKQFQEDCQKNDSVEIIARAITKVSKSMPTNAMYIVTLIQSRSNFISVMDGKSMPMEEISQNIGKVFI